MSNLETAMVRHIARTAFHQTVDKHGVDSALMQARRQATFFIVDLKDDSLQRRLQGDMEDILKELEAT